MASVKTIPSLAGTHCLQIEGVGNMLGAYWSKRQYTWHKKFSRRIERVKAKKALTIN